MPLVNYPRRNCRTATRQESLTWQAAVRSRPAGTVEVESWMLEGSGVTLLYYQEDLDGRSIVV